jgi:hypothetical protein
MVRLMIDRFQLHVLLVVHEGSRYGCGGRIVDVVIHMSWVGDGIGRSIDVRSD